MNVLTRVRKICLSLPETHEKVAWGAPTFRVSEKLFAMFAVDHHGDGRTALWCKAPPGAQEMLVEGDPENFFVPPYVGKGGWVGIRLDRGLDWGVVAGLVEEGWREAAPKRLRAAPVRPTEVAPRPRAAHGRRKSCPRRNRGARVNAPRAIPWIRYLDGLGPFRGGCEGVNWERRR